EPASVRRRFEVIGPWIQIGDAIVLDVDRVVPGASALRWIERLRRLQNDEVGTDRGGQQRRAADHAEGARVRGKVQGWGHYVAGRGARRARPVETQGPRRRWSGAAALAHRSCVDGGRAGIPLIQVATVCRRRGAEERQATT